MYKDVHNVCLRVQEKELLVNGVMNISEIQ